jgi:hypothetical protein
MGAYLSDPNVIANLFAAKFIARPDVKAIQQTTGIWTPHETGPQGSKTRLPWTREDLLAHLDGSRSFGHYLLNTDDTVKLFAFDIDLEKDGDPEKESDPYRGTYVPDFQDANDNPTIEYADARASWKDRSHPGRAWYKFQLKMVASLLAKYVHDELDLPVAVAYSGGKGVHVYGFTGRIPARDARDGARIVLDALGGWAPARGDNFYRSIDRDPISGYPNLSIEVFPKQDSLGGKDLGNLMRLPLGRNLKSTDPTFFIDMRTPMGQMVPCDPEWALTTATPWTD